MKYLKYFNESILSKDIVSDLKDICLEIIDDGFKIDFWNDSELEDDIENNRIKPLNSYSRFEDEQINENEFRMSINHTHRDSFRYSEVSEVVERIKDFMSQRGYEVYVSTMSEDEGGELKHNDIELDLFLINMDLHKKK